MVAPGDFLVQSNVELISIQTWWKNLFPISSEHTIPVISRICNASTESVSDMIFWLLHYLNHATPRKFFRLKNSSNDSDESFHCCGKPEDLYNEYLDSLNAQRLPRGQPELTKPETNISDRDVDSMLVATLCHEHRLMKERTNHEEPPSASGSSGRWPLQSILARSTASIPNLKRKSRVHRTKLWAKRYIEPHINDKSFAYEESEYFRTSSHAYNGANVPLWFFFMIFHVL